MTHQQSRPRYVLHSLDAEIIGQALLGIMESPEIEPFHDLVAKYAFNNVDPHQWYRMDQFMNFYREIMQRPNASDVMISTGMKAFDHVVLPDGIRTIQDGIHMLNAVRHLNMRNINEPDWYEIHELSPTSFQAIETSPFPHDLIYGYMYGLTRRLCPKDLSFTVRRTFLNPDHPDSDGALYEIELT